jgi:hypothetical protein
MMKLGIIHEAGPKATLRSPQRCVICHTMLTPATRRSWSEGSHPARLPGRGGWTVVILETALQTGRYRLCGMRPEDKENK